MASFGFLGFLHFCWVDALILLLYFILCLNSRLALIDSFEQELSTLNIPLVCVAHSMRNMHTNNNSTNTTASTLQYINGSDGQKHPLEILLSTIITANPNPIHAGTLNNSANNSTSETSAAALFTDDCLHPVNNYICTELSRRFPALPIISIDSNSLILPSAVTHKSLREPAFSLTNQDKYEQIFQGLVKSVNAGVNDPSKQEGDCWP